MQPRQTRTVAALLTSVSCSATSMALITTVLGKQVFDLTGSPLELGLLGLAEFAPAALLVFVTGTLADRVDRSKLAGVGLACRRSTSAARLVRGHAPDVDHADLHPGGRVRHRGRVRHSGHACAPRRHRGAGAPALARRASDRGVAGRVDRRPGDRWLPLRRQRPPPVHRRRLLLLVAAVAIMFVHPRRSVDGRRAPRRMHEAVEGVRFVRSQPILLGAISLDLFAVLFGGAVALLPAIAENRLGVGAVGLGLLRAAIGIGAGAVTLFLTVRPVRRRVGRTLLVAVAVFGVGTIALGATTNFVVAFVALMVLSGADSVSVFIRSTLVPLVTPRDKRGRVLAVEAVFIGASNELGAFESGVVGQLFGTPAAVVLGGVGTLVVAALWWGLFPALRNVDRFPVSAQR